MDTYVLVPIMLESLKKFISLALYLLNPDESVVELKGDGLAITEVILRIAECSNGLLGSTVRRFTVLPAALSGVLKIHGNQAVKIHPNAPHHRWISLKARHWGCHGNSLEIVSF